MPRSNPKMQPRNLEKCIDSGFDIHPVITLAQKMNVDYYDFRVVKNTGTTLETKNGDLETANMGGESGCAVRVLYNGSWGFFSTNDISKNGLTYAIEKAFKIAKVSKRNKKEKVKLAEVETCVNKKVIKPKMKFEDISVNEKHDLLIDIDKAVRSVDGIRTCEVNYSDGERCTYLITSEGTELYFQVPRTACQVILVGKLDDQILGYRKRIGATSGFEIYEKKDPVKVSVKAAETAMKILGGKKAPSGRMDLIADPDLTGVFVHEALGHAAEADLIMAGESILKGRLGKKIAADNVTIVDDPTIKGGFGTFPYDDEGVKAEKKDLVKKGKLENYILNRETAKKLGMKANGGARAESYDSRPLVRMSNTMLMGGDHKFEELISGIKKGIYAKGTRGGQVDTAKGTFQFSAQEAYLIENGEIAGPLKEVSFSGETLKTLKNITAIGKKKRMGSPGYCGKGQIVPVGDGGPHIRIKNAQVGGG